MSFLTELSDQLEFCENHGAPPHLIILGKDKFDELCACMMKLAQLVEGTEKATRRPTFDGYPIVVDYNCPEIVEFYYK